MSRRLIIWLVVGVAAAAIIVAGFLVWWHFLAGRVEVPPLTTTPTTPATGTTATLTTTTGSPPPIASLATGLQVPWELAFLPDGAIILTERPGRIRLIDPREGLLPSPLLTVGDVAAVGEGGLLGLALHPDFASNGFAFIYHTYESGGGLANRVVRFVMSGRSLTDETIIIDGIPGAANHDGGRVKFGPDGLLYITTGDAGDAEAAQRLDYLGGKILRLNDDGSIPAENPFPGTPVYSYGHRNPEGLAWDEQGRLWATEHGSSATDELNLIVAGRNYGWPVIRGDETAEGMETPVVQSGSVTWAPSGAAYYEGYILFTGLRGQGLYRYDIAGDILDKYFEGDFGRLRDVFAGPDGYLYLLTSNRDGRGIPTSQDDQLIRVDPASIRP